MLSFTSLPLPDEIHRDIFMMLPLKSIGICRCVCKPWYDLLDLSCPKFIKHHLDLSIQKNNPNIMFTDGRHSYPLMYSTDCASVVSSSSFESISSRFVRIDYPLRGEIKFWGSCDGLICLGDGINLCIWNPLTREYKNVRRQPYVSDFDGIVGYGFGYDCAINDYKLVAIVDHENSGRHFQVVHVYTLGLDSWKTTRAFQKCRVKLRKYPGVLVNGALHWLGVKSTQQTSYELMVDIRNENYELMVSFDISNEKLVYMSCPEETNVVGPANSKDVLVLGNRLYLFFNIPGIRTDVWGILDNGENKSWTKCISTSHGILSKKFGTKPVWFLGNDIILIRNSRGFVLWNTKNDTITKGCSIGWWNLEIYVESLVSLNSGTYVENRAAKLEHDVGLGSKRPRESVHHPEITMLHDQFDRFCL